MTRVPAEHEALSVLHRIERGELLVKKSCPWEKWSNVVVFTTADGWRFVVFNDFGQWDYIERVHAPDGGTLEVGAHTPTLDDYEPRSIDAARGWGLSSEEASLLLRCGTA